MLNGKYRTWGAYHWARIKRFICRCLIRPLMRWGPLERPAPGYTIVVACHARFPEMLIASLRLLAGQDLANMSRLIVTFDAPRDATLAGFERRMRDEFPLFRMLFLYQTRFQALVLRAIRWGWVDCWLSYCKGIARSETRYVMLHDMDAMLFRPGLVEERYATIRERGDQFLGYGWYTANGVRDCDRLVIIVEMICDCEFLRNRFRPIDLFNRVTIRDGVTMDLDTLLYPQTLAEGKSIRPLSEADWAHPGQIISQFTYLASGRGYIPPETNQLFYIPYFLYLGGVADALADFGGTLSRSDPRRVSFFGHDMDMRLMSIRHLKWVIKNILRMENAIAGGVRPEVRRYLEAIQSKCTGAPTASLVPEVEEEVRGTGMVR